MVSIHNSRWDKLVYRLNAIKHFSDDEITTYQRGGEI